MATIISYSVFVGILLRSQPFFLQVDDLREELGFAIAIAIYGFVKMAVDSKVKQSDVVSSSDLANYIKRKFDCFYRRYKKEILIKNGAGEIWIILFSIMIFEDFNRGTFKRTAEYVLFPFRKRATLGIMQVETDKFITSLDSIRLAYNRIEHDYLELENEHDWESIVYEIAIRYNSDERYGENVSYIYHVLREYIVESAEFRADFGVSKDPNKYYINVLNVTEDRLNDLLSTCDKQTDLGDGCVKDTKHEQKFRVEKDGTSSRLHFENVSNALIDFAEHNSMPDAVSSIVVKECQNVEFLNMSITNTAGKCAIIVKDSSTITFKDSKLNVMDSKTIKVKNSSIILNGIKIESNDEERLKP
ncbi:MAG: hypothetical protein E7278_02265 [Lachnospiraceae bacterium]|nr:hypothetical protein [Lachnospiraceae bacterium]